MTNNSITPRNTHDEKAMNIITGICEGILFLLFIIAVFVLLEVCFGS